MPQVTIGGETVDVLFSGWETRADAYRFALTFEQVSTEALILHGDAVQDTEARKHLLTISRIPENIRTAWALSWEL